MEIHGPLPREEHYEMKREEERALVNLVGKLSGRRDNLAKESVRTFLLAYDSNPIIQKRCSGWHFLCCTLATVEAVRASQAMSAYTRRYLSG